MKRVKNNTEEKTKRTKVDDSSGQLGIIESVSLVNFMCHENLMFQFGPRINFVIGKNGSGKSALLTAIILALGGRSSVTGRYPNLKGFVLQGKQKAKIEVTLKNSGNQAYKQDIYGSQIIVVREINCDGGGSYKIKAANGRIISQTKEELSKILTVMNIQIENPVSLLTQECSRTFLTAKKPEKLYQFFYKGTGLESLEVGYNIIQHNKEEAAEELIRKKEILSDLEKQLKNLEKVLDTTAKVVDLKKELLWATINEIEKRLAEKKKDLDRSQNELSFMKEEHARNQNLLSEKSNKFSDLKTERDDCDKDLETLREKLTELNQQKENLCAALRLNEGKLSSLKRNQNSTLNEIKSLEKSMIDKNLKNRSSFEEDEAHRKQEIATLNEVRRKCSEKVAQMTEKTQMEMSKYNELKLELESIKPDENMLLVKKRKLESYIHHHQATQQSQINKFGLKTADILKEMQLRKHQFSKLPMGPLGRYLNVRDPKWAPAVEACLSTSLLHSFCCDNIRDSLVLKDILKKHYRDNMPSVIVSKFLPSIHSGLRKAESGQFPTVLDMLEIENPVIANCLIDLVRIESKILIEDKNTAVNVMLESPPRNCVSAYLLDCSNIVLNPFRIYAGTQRTNQQSLLSSAQATDINSIKEEIHEINTALADLSTREKSLRKSLDHIPVLSRELGQKIMEQNVRIRNISAKIRDLETTEDSNNSLLNMEEDLEQLKAEYQKNRPEIEEYENNVQEAGASVENVQTEMQEHKSSLQSVTKKHKEICSLMSSCLQEQEMVKRDLDKLTRDIEEQERAVSDPLQEELENEAQNLERRTSEALNIGPRITTKRSCETISRLLSETEKVVRQHSNGSRDEMLAKYKEKMKKLKDAKENLIVKEKNVELIDKMYRKRKENFKAVNIYTQTCVDMAYMVLMKNYFTGRLIFNNEKRLLNLEACPKKSGVKPSGGGKCVSLSGGEKSFVTIAFLLAMWERIKTPFKILDEYDVFMDSNNRKLSIDLLIGQAKMMPDSQFIFLSPLELPQIKDSPLIKLLQMPAPKRDMGNMDIE